MTFLFTPPLQLAGTPSVCIRSLDDAVDFLGAYAGRWPVTRNLMLRRLRAASNEQESRDAAKSFRWWAEMERLVVERE